MPGLSDLRRTRVLSPVARLRRYATYRGLKGQRGWLMLSGALWVGGRVRRAVARQPESVVLPRVRPGETLMVTPRRPLTRRERRAVRRAR